MAEISKISVGGTQYDIKDATARQLVTNTLHFRGVTTTAVTNGGTQIPTDIYGASATVANITVGDMIIYGKGEYIWAKSDGNGAVSDTGHWILIDALNAYGSLASKNAISVNSVDAHTHSIGANKVVVAVAGASTTASVDYTPAGSVSSSLSNATAAAQSITLNGGLTGKLQTATYTPSTTSISIIDSVGSVPSLTKNDKTVVTSITNVNKFIASVSGEVLTLSASDPAITTSTATQITAWTAGSVPTKKSVTVATGGSITYATGKTTADGKTFGTAVAIALHSGASAASSTVTGTVSSTFTGTKASISHTFTPKVNATLNAAAISTTSAGDHSHAVSYS